MSLEEWEEMRDGLRDLYAESRKEAMEKIRTERAFQEIVKQYLAENGEQG